MSRAGRDEGNYIVLDPTEQLSDEWRSALSRCMDYSSKTVQTDIQECSATGFEIHRPHEVVAAAHHTGNPLIALTLPFLNRIGLVPGLIELLILT